MKAKGKPKQQEEKMMVEEMIALYCRGVHGAKKEVCQECRELAEYAGQRIECCPFMESKSFCSYCPVHCYNEEMRAKIRKVMGWAGPRMLLYHPVLAVQHMLLGRQNNWRKAK